MGSTIEAYRCFEQSLTLDENNIPTLISYGKTLAADGWHEEAYECFEQALAQKGNHIPTLVSYGNA